METIRVYKLFRRDDKGLHPLFIDRELILPTGEWLEARAPDIEKLGALGEGYYLVSMPTKCYGISDERPNRFEIAGATHIKNRWIEIAKDKKGNRRYYDLGVGSNGQVLRFAHRPGWHSSATPSLPGVNMEGKVWAECLIPADDYYILHRNVSGVSKTHEPIDWYISQKLLIERVLP